MPPTDQSVIISRYTQFIKHWPACFRPTFQHARCLWFLAHDKKNGRFRDRRSHVLFIDARKLGTLIDGVHREPSEVDIQKIADTYHAWRGNKGCKTRYEDIPGFCKSATLDDIRHHGHVLTPGRPNWPMNCGHPSYTGWHWWHKAGPKLHRRGVRETRAIW